MFQELGGESPSSTGNTRCSNQPIRNQFAIVCLNGEPSKPVPASASSESSTYLGLQNFRGGCYLWQRILFVLAEPSWKIFHWGNADLVEN